MKILMIIKKLDYSGAPKMFMWLADNLSKQGVNVTIFTFMKSEGVEISPLIRWIKVNPSEKSNYYKTYKLLRILVREENFDCSISFLLDSNILNMLVCKGLKTKSIICERNDPFKPGYYKLKLLKPLFTFADGAVFQLRKVCEYYDNIKNNIAIIPNPVRKVFSLEVLPFCERDDVIVSVGRLDIFQKRQDVLIKAFSLFSKSHPNYKLHIYGNGTKKDTKILINLINSLRLNDKVFLMGVTENPQEKIKNAKIFAFTSDFEGIPNSLIEAMSIGLPCVATNCRPGGAALLIKDNINGCLVSTGDIMGVSEKLSLLVDSPQMAQNIGQEAKKIVNEFSEEKIIQMWMEYLNTMKYE